MIRTAIIEAGIVTNVVMHDPQGDWTPPDGSILIVSETASVGDNWDGGTFSRPPLAPEQTNAAIRARLAEIDARSVRPLRAILDAQAAGLTPSQADVGYLAELKAQADALRAQLL